MDSQNISPNPQTVPVEIDFPTAISAILAGQKVTKAEWDNKDIYGVLRNGFLMLHKENDTDYKWIISEADANGTDYQVIFE